MEKTNVMRLLGQKKIPYEAHSYDSSVTEGTKVAELVGKPQEHTFKTLVTESNTKEHFVFVIPVAESLDLKKAARAVGVKAIAMIKQKDLLPLTGYIHGGCSPVGMKKQFKTVIHKSAESLETFCVSAGKVGYQVEVSPLQLAELVHAQFADIITEQEQ